MDKSLDMHKKLYEFVKIIALFISVFSFIYVILDHFECLDSWLGLKDVKMFDSALETSYGYANRILKPTDKAWKPLLNLIKEYSAVKLPIDREPKAIGRFQAMDSKEIKLGGSIYQWTSPETPFAVFYVDLDKRSAVSNNEFVMVGTLEDINRWCSQKLSNIKFLIMDIIVGILSIISTVIIWNYERKKE